MEPAHEIPSLELLLAQEGWVRALARKLVGRESEAEDVAQSALAAALEHPPRSGENAPVLRAWLAQVARRLVIGGQRAGSRRAERERRAAREEALPSASEIHAQEEERRIVVEALLTLSEPFRTTLLLRYYRGLEPIEIARAMEVPDSTVRNRLARGLAQLKQKLEARQGSDWRASCALLAGPLVPASKGFLIGKGVVMGVNLKVAISCSFVALAGLAWWELRRSGAEGPKPAQLQVAGVQSLSSDTDKRAEDASKASAMRAKVEQEPAATGATTLAANDPVGILVYGAVRQSDGGQTHGRAWVRLLSPDGRELTNTADESGAFAFTGLSAGDWLLSAALTGYRKREVSLRLATAEPVRRMDLSLDARLRIPVRFQAPDGRRLKTVLNERKPSGMLLDINLGVIATEHTPAPTSPTRTLGRFLGSDLGEYFPFEGGENAVGARPVSEGNDGDLVVEPRFPMFLSATWRGVVIDSRRCESAPEAIVFVIEPEQVISRIGGFRVRLLDAVDHSPLTTYNFQLALRDYTAVMGPHPREDGVLECTQLPPGTIQFSLSSPGHEPLIEMIDVEPGVVRDLGTRELAQTSASDVEIVDPAGKPLGSVRFRYSDSAADTGLRPFEPSSSFESDSKGILKCRSGPAPVWVISDDPKWTAEPLLLAGASGQRIVMQAGSELVAVLGDTIHVDAILSIRDHNGKCVVVERARSGSLVRSRLLPGHYDVELVTFDGSIAKKSIDLGDKPLVIDLAP